MLDDNRLEAKSLHRIKQQKCLAHLQRTLGDVLTGKKRHARDLTEGARELLWLAVQCDCGKSITGVPEESSTADVAPLPPAEQPEVEPTNNRVEMKP
jgi:hypothetical protein